MTAHCTTEDETLTASGKLRAFVNIYPPMVGACGSAYKTRQLADQMAGKSRIACVEMEYEAGGGGMTVITLPFPVSVNAMFSDGKTRRHKSQKYCDWILEAGYALNLQHPPRIKGKVRIQYVLQDNIDNRERDAFNFEKGVTDLLVSHGVIEKDSNRILRGGSIDWDDHGTVTGIQITIVPHRVQSPQTESAAT